MSDLDGQISKSPEVICIMTLKSAHLSICPFMGTLFFEGRVFKISIQPCFGFREALFFPIRTTSIEYRSLRLRHCKCTRCTSKVFDGRVLCFLRWPRMPLSMNSGASLLWHLPFNGCEASIETAIVQFPLEIQAEIVVVFNIIIMYRNPLLSL